MNRSVRWSALVLGLGLVSVGCPGAGTTGPKGETGTQGAAGAQGAQGLEGAPGGYGYFPDPHFDRGLEKWTITPANAGALKDVAVLDAPPPGGVNVIENVPTLAPVIESTQFVPYNPLRTYEVSGMFRASDMAGSAGKVTLGVRFYAADKSLIDIYKGVDMQTPGTTWTMYSAKFGAGTSATVPANAQYMRVAAILNIDTGDVPGNRLFQITGLSVTPTSPPKIAPIQHNGCDNAVPSGSVTFNPIQFTFNLPRAQSVSLQAGYTTTTTAGSRYTSLIVDGSYVETAYESALNAGDWVKHSHFWVGTLGAGNHTVMVQTWSGYGGYCGGAYARASLSFSDL